MLGIICDILDLVITAIEATAYAVKKFGIENLYLILTIFVLIVALMF